MKVPVPTSEDFVALKSQIMYYGDMTGATTNKKGESGLVPAPAEGNANRYLCSNGTWKVPPDTNTWQANTASQNGYVLAAGSSYKNKVWKTDSNGAPGWRDDANTTYTFNGDQFNNSSNSISLKLVPVNKGGTGATALGAKPGVVSTTTGGTALNYLGICAGTASPPNLTAGCFYIKYSS